MFQFFAQGSDHPTQAIRADMRLGQIANFRRRTSTNQGIQYLGDTGIANPGNELPIGKGSRPPFAKLHITFEVQLTTRPESLNIVKSLGNWPPPFQYQWGKTICSQTQGGK